MESGSACDKTSYPGRTSARRAAKRISDDAGERFRAYYCSECRAWHITRQPKFEAIPVMKGRARIGRGRRPREGQSLEDLAREMRGLPKLEET